MKDWVSEIKKNEHGFKHIIEAGNAILSEKKLNHFQIAQDFFKDESYQARMLATYLAGQLAVENPQALQFLEKEVASDPNWRVQEMLAKAFDHFCKSKGYEQAVPQIKKWLANKNSNIQRAVVEGLRIWTTRAYFRDHPEIAIHLIAQCKYEESEYLRKSIGNALRDVRKKLPHLVDAEVAKWNLNNHKLAFLKNLIMKN